jgi:AcrR family transcriptional regulator
MPATAKATRNGRKSRRDDILACFTSKVAANGYDEVSLREIAEELGLSKGTILHHFHSKDALLEEVMSDYMERLILGITQIAGQLETPTERLAGCVYQLMLLQELDRDATVACSREITRFVRRDVMREVRRLRDEYEGKIEEIIDAGVGSGEFAAANRKILALQVLGMCNWSWTWFRPGLEWTCEDIARTFIDTLFTGLTHEDLRLQQSDHERIAHTVEEIFRSTLAGSPTARPIAAASRRQE